jgi:hypothetical protein
MIGIALGSRVRIKHQGFATENPDAVYVVDGVAPWSIRWVSLEGQKYMWFHVRTLETVKEKSDTHIDQNGGNTT